MQVKQWVFQHLGRVCPLLFIQMQIQLGDDKGRPKKGTISFPPPIHLFWSVYSYPNNLLTGECGRRAQLEEAPRKTGKVTIRKMISAFVIVSGSGRIMPILRTLGEGYNIFDLKAWQCRQETWLNTERKKAFLRSDKENIVCPLSEGGKGIWEETVKSW